MERNYSEKPKNIFFFREAVREIMAEVLGKLPAEVPPAAVRKVIADTMFVPQFRTVQKAELKAAIRATPSVMVMRQAEKLRVKRCIKDEFYARMFPQRAIPEYKTAVEAAIGNMTNQELWDEFMAINKR